MSLRQHFFFIGLTLFCLACIVGGIVIAVNTGNAGNGQKGGVIAIALSFGFLFLRNNHGAIIKRIITVDLPRLRQEIFHEPNALMAPVLKLKDEEKAALQPIVERLEILSKKFDALEASIRLESEGQSSRNRYLAFISIVGTFFAGFGDLVAHWFI